MIQDSSQIPFADSNPDTQAFLLQRTKISLSYPTREFEEIRKRIIERNVLSEQWMFDMIGYELYIKRLLFGIWFRIPFRKSSNRVITTHAFIYKDMDKEIGIKDFMKPYEVNIKKLIENCVLRKDSPKWTYQEEALAKWLKEKREGKTSSNK